MDLMEIDCEDGVYGTGSGSCPIVGISGVDLSCCAVISRTVPGSAVLTFPPLRVSVAAQGVTISRLSVKLHSNDPLYRRRVQNCPELGAVCQSQATDGLRHTSLP
jgi:hypothetical protein